MFGQFYWEKDPIKIVELGLRSSPVLDFDIGGLATSLTDSQRQQLKKAFLEGKRIWANIYEARINPLNDKLLGPDENIFKGQGFLTQIEPVFKFKFTFEVRPAAVSNIVAGFQVPNEWNWGNQVWGELVKVGDGDNSSLSSINVEQQPAQQAQQENNQQQKQVESAGRGESGTAVKEPSEPPSPVHEEVPPSPDPTFVWIGGSWEWYGNWGWAWGHWAAPPHQGAIWIHGSWVKSDHGYVWVKSHWQ